MEAWRENRLDLERLVLSAAWHSAALARQKRMPSLEHFLDPPKTVKLTGEAAERAKAEHEAMLREFEEARRKRG